MMKYWNFCLLSATSSCFCLLAHNLNASVLSYLPSESRIQHSHIHLSLTDLSRFSPNLFLDGLHNKSYKTASVCFITDTSDCRDVPYDIPDYNICVEEGFDKTSCPDEFYIPENFCPYDSKYFAICRDACADYVECHDPYYGVGQPCRGKYERCECDLCSGYVFEADIPRGYHKNGQTCNSCDGLKHKYEINSCIGFSECLETGPENGAEICWRGDTPTYSSCKPCPNRGNLDKCPENYICEYEDCSDKYYKIGCDDGFIWDENTLTCTPECDPNDRSCQCPGKVYCDPETKVGTGDVCTTADGTAFYDGCLVKETCLVTYLQKDPNFPNCKFRTESKEPISSVTTKDYLLGKYCTTQGGKSYYRWCDCTSSLPDPNGNISPCAGKKLCNDDLGYGEPCICGGKKYFDKCDECSLVNQHWENNENGIGGWCWDTTNPQSYYESDDYHGGNFFAGEKCTRLDGSKIYLTGLCGHSQGGCLGAQNFCGGMKNCENDEGAEGEIACECGGRKYFNKCKEECTYDTGEYFHETSVWFTKDGYYMDKITCTRLDGTKVGTRKYCADTTADASGAIPPCSGMKTCPSGTYGTGDICSCGGLLFTAGDCVTECSYEDTKETCSAKGGKFTAKCYGAKTNGIQQWYGECK